jgi:hypothetical protein
MHECGLKRQLASCLNNFQNFFVWRDVNDFLSRLLTMEENWLYLYDPETKQQSVEWRHNGLPHPAPQNFRGQKFAKIFNASIIWDLSH